MIAANPGPAAHMALLGAVIVIGLIVYTIVRVRHRREAAEAEKLDQAGTKSEHSQNAQHEHRDSGHHR